jgi:hypothetical protein
MEAVSTSETSVNLYETTGAISQKAAIFNTQALHPEMCFCCYVLCFLACCGWHGRFSSPYVRGLRDIRYFSRTFVVCVLSLLTRALGMKHKIRRNLGDRCIYTIVMVFTNLSFNSISYNFRVPFLLDFVPYEEYRSFVHLFCPSVRRRRNRIHKSEWRNWNTLLWLSALILSHIDDRPHCLTAGNFLIRWITSVP